MSIEIIPTSQAKETLVDFARLQPRVYFVLVRLAAGIVSDLLDEADDPGPRENPTETMHRRLSSSSRDKKWSQFADSAVPDEKEIHRRIDKILPRIRGGLLPDDRIRYEPLEDQPTHMGVLLYRPLPLGPIKLIIAEIFRRPTP